MDKLKIGKVPGKKGDRFGYYPDLYSTIINRSLARSRKSRVDVDAAMTKAFGRAKEIKERFIRRYCK